MYVPTLSKIFGPVSRNTIFFIWPKHENTLKSMKLLILWNYVLALTVPYNFLILMTVMFMSDISHILSLRKTKNILSTSLYKVRPIP